MAKIKHIGQQSVRFEEAPYIIGWGSIAGKKEGDGPLGSYIDQIEMDPMMGKDNWEAAEGEFQKKVVKMALHRCGLNIGQIQYIVCGDLQSQLTGCVHGMMEFQRPMFGVYGACSTMGESMSLGAMMINGGFANYVIAVTSSHTEVAERQFRYPVAYGSQKPLSATWTVTGSGAVILGQQPRGKGPWLKITGVTTGKMMDFGVQDSMNMGACMAPAAANVILAHFDDFDTSIDTYDKIVTGDLGTVGRDILFELTKTKKLDIQEKYMDCGIEIYNNEEQDVHAGGSGCGCSAVVLTSLLFRKLLSGEWKKILFIPTGALLSKISFNEGNTIPGIAHGVVIEREE